MNGVKVKEGEAGDVGVCVYVRERGRRRDGRRGRSRENRNLQREGENRKEQIQKKREILRERNRNEREKIQSRSESGSSPMPEAVLTSLVHDVKQSGVGGGPGEHACAHTGQATEPPCQGKHVSPGTGMSRLLSPPAAQDLQAFEMQD